MPINILTCERRSDGKYNVEVLMHYPWRLDTYIQSIVAELREENDFRYWSYYEVDRSEFIYAEALTPYIRVVKNNLYEEVLYGDYHDADVITEYVNMELLFNSRYYDQYKVYFALEDIDGNGIPELFIGASDEISSLGYYDIFTYDGTKTVRPCFNLGYEIGRTSYLYAYSNGIFEIDWRGSAIDNGHKFYRIGSDGYSLELVESVSRHGDHDNPNAPMKYYRGEEDLISENELNVIVEMCRGAENAELDWIEIKAEANLITQNERTTIWDNFIASEGYLTHTKDWDATSLEYVITDLNSDGISDLIIQSESDAPFYNTWIFFLDGKEIVLVNETYGYGSFRYSPSQNAIIGSPEWKPFLGTGYSPFYKLNGTQLEYVFEIGQDEGQSFYSDDSGRRDISDNERISYYADVVNFQWNRIK